MIGAGRGGAAEYPGGIPVSYRAIVHRAPSHPRRQKTRSGSLTWLTIGQAQKGYGMLYSFMLKCRAGERTSHPRRRSPPTFGRAGHGIRPGQNAGHLSGASEIPDLLL